MASARLGNPSRQVGIDGDLAPFRRVARLDPIIQHIAEIGERVALGAHVPVEHRLDAPGIGAVEQAVVEPVVVVQQRRRARLRQMRAEPVEHRRHRAAERSACSPPCAACQRRVQPGELAFEIALRPAEIAEPDFGRRHQMQIGERVDQRLADAPVELGPAGEFGRDVVADHKTVAPLLDDEHGADDAFVLAQQQALRRQRKAPVQAPRGRGARARMSCAPGGIGPSGGRRSTNSLFASPKRSR